MQILASLDHQDIFPGRPCSRRLLDLSAQPNTKEATMRLLLLAALAITAFIATIATDTTDANAVVCARGVVRAGCAGPRGAAVVRRPVAACRYVVVNGVRVRRCV